MNELHTALEKVISEITTQRIEIELTRPEPGFGDFSTNIALRLSKQLKKSPREVAVLIIERLKNQLEEGHDISVAGPGFINITIPDTTLLKNIENMSPEYGNNNRFKKQSIIVEFTDPNPFKELHIGHAYSNTIGESIARLFEAGGGSVVRASYHGDVGMHVAKAMWGILSILQENRQNLDDIEESQRSLFLGTAYARGATSFDEDEEVKREITALNKQIYHLDDEPTLQKIYETSRAWSFQYFEDIYARLQTGFDVQYLESQAVSIGTSTAHEALEKGILSESNGAIIFKGEEYGLHTRVFINSESLPTYEAKELGLAQLKANDYKYDRSIIITAEEQSSYFAVLIKVLQLLRPDLGNKTEHIAHGVVKLSSGKMSSRTGKVVSAKWLLDTVNDAVHEKAPQSPANTENMLGAIKYTFLKHKIGGDIIFDIEESISLEGNSGPYLQYALVRANSILIKATAQKVMPQTITTDERIIVSKISEFPEVVERSQQSRSPHNICNYLYELAQVFNRFYEHNRIIDDTREAERLYIVAAYAQTMKNALNILNIPTPERM